MLHTHFHRNYKKKKKKKKEIDNKNATAITINSCNNNCYRKQKTEKKQNYKHFQEASDLATILREFIKIFQLNNNKNKM